jgi:endonuclease/exonuclease/phosphatase family metal-dependent hydrolase
VPLLVRTWNVFHGNTHPPQRRAFLQEMVELVTRDEPDVVCLQELPVWALAHLEAWSGMEGVAAVARTPRAVSARLGRWLTEVNHGMLRSALTGEADAILVAHGHALADARSQVASAGGLRRNVHGVRVDDVYVANFHTSAAPEQLRAVAEFVAGEERAVVAGDANVRPPYDLEGFSRPLAGSIDQVLVRGLPSSPPIAWPEERRRVGGRLLSDHAPVELTVG